MSDATTTSLWDMTLRDFLSVTASARPTPGGGSVSAVGASLGLGLVIMALEISLNRKDAKDPGAIRELLAEGRVLLDETVHAAEADVQAFDSYMTAWKLPNKDDAQKQQRRIALDAASVAATESPLHAAALFVYALRLAARAVPLTHSNVLSDVAAGAGLLDGALRAVLFNVDINLLSLRDATFQARCGATRVSLERESAQLAADVLQDVSLSLVGREKIVQGKELLKKVILESHAQARSFAGRSVGVILFGQHEEWGEDRYQSYRISAQEKLHCLAAAGFTICTHHLRTDLPSAEFEKLLGDLRADAGTLAVSVQMPVPSGLVECLVRLGEKDLDAVAPGSSAICAVAEAAIRLVQPWSAGGVAVVGARGFVGSAVCRGLAALGVSTLPLDIGDDLSRVREMRTVISSANAPEILDARHLATTHEMVVDIGFCPIGREFKKYVGTVSRAAYGIPKRITEAPGCMGPLAMTVLIERLVRRVAEGGLPAWSFPFPPDAPLS